MSVTKYLLPCSCGKQLEVDATQAGLELQCQCGEAVEVPTLRGLGQLERAKATADTSTQPGWGSRQGVLFLGGTLILGGLLTGVFLLATGPSLTTADAIYEENRNMSASELWLHWNELKDGPQFRRESPIGAYVDSIANEYVAETTLRRRWLLIAFLVLGAGVLVIGIGFGREERGSRRRGGSRAGRRRSASSSSS